MSEISSIDYLGQEPEIQNEHSERTDEEIVKEIVGKLEPYKDVLSRVNPIFMNGWGEPKDSGYQGVMAKAYEGLGIGAQFEELSGGDNPDFEENKKRFLELIKNSEKPVVLITHSLGSQLALRSLTEDYDGPEIPLMIGAASAVFNPHNIRHRYVEKFPTKIRPLGDFAARNFRERTRGSASSFYPNQYPDYKNFTNLPIQKAVFIASTDDNGILYDEHQRFARTIGAIDSTTEKLTDDLREKERLVLTVQNGGHLNYPSAALNISNVIAAYYNSRQMPIAA